MTTFVDHHLVNGSAKLDPMVRYELKPIRDKDGNRRDDLYAAWITFDNPAQYNAYTTEMIKSTILAFRKASVARNVVAVVFTAAGDKAFCSGGNTKEYAEYYVGQPEEYRQYLGLFNGMVSSILECDKPVICRVNGMRVGGGQEIGMACDFSVASDLANFGQAGPKHGSAPDGGSTDFLPLYVGVEQAMYSCTLCEPWSALKSKRLGLISEAVPVLKVEGEYIANPMVISDRWVDDRGNVVYGEFKTGEERERGKALLAKGEVDLSPLDAVVEDYITKLAYTMPHCLIKTVKSVRKHKLVHWDKNRESNREWLALNMLTEANAGFRAFNEGPKGNREVDFLKLRSLLASGERWGNGLIEQVLPR